MRLVFYYYFFLFDGLCHPAVSHFTSFAFISLSPRFVNCHSSTSLHNSNSIFNFCGFLCTLFLVFLFHISVLTLSSLKTIYHCQIKLTVDGGFLRCSCTGSYVHIVFPFLKSHTGRSWISARICRNDPKHPKCSEILPGVEKGLPFRFAYRHGIFRPERNGILNFLFFSSRIASFFSGRNQALCLSHISHSQTSLIYMCAWTVKVKKYRGVRWTRDDFTCERKKKRRSRETHGKSIDLPSFIYLFILHCHFSKHFLKICFKTPIIYFNLHFIEISFFF